MIMSKPEGQEEIGRWEVQLRKGSLGLAVLACLWEGPLYGLEILRRLESRADLAVPEGTIYPLLTRLKAEDLVSSHWVESDAGHPRKYYTLTETGRGRVRELTGVWASFAASLDALLQPIRKEIGHG
jgi:PadR family transcriptional regulator PadR